MCYQTPKCIYLVLSSLLVCLFSVAVSETNSKTCQFAGENFHLNLDKFNGQKINVKPSSYDYDIIYSPCKNGLSCDDGIGHVVPAMAVANQQYQTYNACLAYLATWDADIKPTYSKEKSDGHDHDQPTYTFVFNNGEVGAEPCDAADNKHGQQLTQQFSIKYNWN